MREADRGVELEIDVAVLKTEIKKTYASVSEEPDKDFIFPTGRGWAEDLDYPPELANVPERAVESFAGVANPFSLGRPHPDRRHDHSESGQRRGPTQHRPLDRLNSRGAAGGSVRQAPRAASVRADRDRPACRHLRALEVRGHAPQGGEVRRSGHHRQGVQACRLAHATARLSIS